MVDETDIEDNGEMIDFYELAKKRQGRIIHPPNILKSKVGNGGLPPAVLDKAEAVIEKNDVDFKPQAQQYLELLSQGIEVAKEPADIGTSPQDILDSMIFPCMQIKANAGMFHFEVVTNLADVIVALLESINVADKHVIALVENFRDSVSVILAKDMTGDGGAPGKALVKEMRAASQRYLDKYPENLRYDDIGEFKV